MYELRVVAATAVFAMVSLLPAAGQTGQPTSQPTEVAVAPMDAVADQRVRAMSDHLAGQRSFRFDVEIAYDAVEYDGQKVQLARSSRVEVVRPNRLRVDSRGDRGWSKVNVFDGANFLVHDRSQNVYARVATPATLDEFFDFLFEKYGVSPPVADFLLSDVHSVLTREATSAAVLGDAIVAGKECDHIAFTGDLLDWQIWIEKGDRPWPRKFIITYKDIDVRPQFTAVFRDWETGATPAANAFDATPPAGAAEVPFERFAGNGAPGPSDDAASDNETTTGGE